MRLHIRQRVIWNGTETKQGKFIWLKKGMQGTIIKHYPKIKGNDIILGYDDNGKPIIDIGVKEWYTVDFGKAGKRAIDNDSIKNKTVKVLK